MSVGDDEAANHLVTENSKVKGVLTWIGGIFCALFALSILATNVLPRPAETAISSILLNVAVIVFLCAVPFFGVILWKAQKSLSGNGYWGLLLLLAGIEILLPVGAILIFFSTFLPALSYPFPVLIAALMVMGVGFAFIVLGLLFVCIQLMREIIRLFRDRRQAHMGDESQR